MSNATASSRRLSLRLDGSEPMVAMLSPSQPDVCRFTRTTLVAARFGYIHTITQLSDLERRCLSCESKRAAAPAPRMHASAMNASGVVSGIFVFEMPGSPRSFWLAGFASRRVILGY